MLNFDPVLVDLRREELRIDRAEQREAAIEADVRLAMGEALREPGAVLDAFLDFLQDDPVELQGLILNRYFHTAELHFIDQQINLHGVEGVNDEYNLGVE